MWTIEMFPAAEVDALWIEYGDAGAPRRILIDGGRAPTFDALRARALSLPQADRRLDLLVVTHVDADHIEGVVRLLGDTSIGLEIGEVWFNGWKHLSDALGPVQGEYLTALIDRRQIPWNAAFGEKAVVLPDEGPLPTVDLPDDMRLTLLSPTRAQLAALAPVWREEVEKAGLAPGVPAEAFERLTHDARLRPPPDVLGAIDLDELAEEEFVPDGSEANGSSIVVLAEHDGRAAVLAGDGVTGVLDQTVPRLLTERQVETLDVDVFKLPHHGSKHNTDEALLTSVRAGEYLFSSSGARFGHPDEQTVARVLVHGTSEPTLVFNYRSEDNELWDDDELRAKHSYSTAYPDPGAVGIRVDV